MGGVKDIWDKAKDNELNNRKEKFEKMSSNDGKL